MKNITIKENPFAGFEQFALTAEEARMVKGGKPFAYCGRHLEQTSAAGAKEHVCYDSTSYSESITHGDGESNAQGILCFHNFERGSETYNQMVKQFGSDPCV